MVNGYFSQGTTSKQIFELPRDLKIADYSVTYLQTRPFLKIVKEKNDCTEAVDGDIKYIQSALLPDNSRLFRAGAIVEVQLRVVTEDNEEINSDTYTLRVEKGLYYTEDK